MRGLPGWIFGDFVAGRAAIGLLLLRLVFGAGMMVHGWPKFQNAFHWMDKNPNAPPSIVQALAALGEFGGGAALLFGCFTPLGAIGVICTMLGAFLLVHRNDPWISTSGKSWELASLYFIVALTLLFCGPGRFSLDWLLFGSRRGSYGGRSKR